MLNRKELPAAGQQSGNALFLILIAVALFAALSYAITQSGRGSGAVDKETAMINAASVTSYPAGLRTAATRMMITGTPMQGTSGIDVTIAAQTTVTNRLFNLTGGGAVVVPPPTAAVDATLTAWTFVDALAAADGVYIIGVGTDTQTSGREVVAALGNATLGVTLSTCQQIIKGLGFAAPYTPIVRATANMVWTPGPVVAAGGSATSLTLTGALGNPFLCFQNDGTAATPPYNYYHALAEG